MDVIVRYSRQFCFYFLTYQVLVLYLRTIAVVISLDLGALVLTKISFHIKQRKKENENVFKSFLMTLITHFNFSPKLGPIRIPIVS